MDKNTSGKLVFREGARMSDAAEVERIVRSSKFFEEVEDEISSAVGDLRESLNGGGTTYLFAELDGRVAGFVSFEKIACTDANYQIYWIAVDNSFRGCGIGSKLINRALDIMRLHGGRTVYLQTAGRPQYMPTREFYKKNGWTHEATLKDYYVVGDDCCIFSIKL